MTDTRRDPASVLPLTPAMFHVLLSLAGADRHGYAIMKEVAERTGGDVELSTGTLYGLIKRLLADGMIAVALRPDAGQQRASADERAGRGGAGQPGSRERRREGARRGEALRLRDDERRRYYRLTDFGRAVAAAEAERLARVVRTARTLHLLGRSEG